MSKEEGYEDPFEKETSSNLKEILNRLDNIDKNAKALTDALAKKIDTVFNELQTTISNLEKQLQETKKLIRDAW
jgi:prefoldin subunit 5